MDEEFTKLQDPIAVHANMLAGKIAKPSVEQILHLYPELAKRIENLEKDLAKPTKYPRVRQLVWQVSDQCMTSGPYIAIKRSKCRQYPVEGWELLYRNYMTDHQLGEGISDAMNVMDIAQKHHGDRILKELQW